MQPTNSVAPSHTAMPFTSRVVTSNKPSVSKVAPAPAPNQIDTTTTNQPRQKNEKEKQTMNKKRGCIICISVALVLLLVTGGIIAVLYFTGL